MSARTAPGLAALALLSAGAVQAAEPAGVSAGVSVSAPVIRAVSTPAGQMLVLEVPQSPAAAAATAAATARKPDTEVQMTPAGPMLVLRAPATAPNTNAATANARLANVSSSIPANARAEALPNGAQMLVLPSAVPAAPLPVQRAVVEIDPAKVGTRPVDTPRSDVLYRPKVEPAAATR